MFILCILIIVALILSIKLLPIVSSSSPQIFSDFIIENVSESSLNKSNELALFWGIAILGSLFLCICLFLLDKIKSKKDVINTKDSSMFDRVPIFSLILVLPFIIYFVFYGKISIPLLLAVLLYTISFYAYKKDAYIILSTFPLFYYGLLGAIVLFTKVITISAQVYQNIVLLIAFFLSLSFLIISKVLLSNQSYSEATLNRFILCIQFSIPLLVLNWLTDKYLYQGEIIKVTYSVGYYIFFLLLLIACMTILVFHTKKHWGDMKLSLDNSIHVITPMVIFAFHSFQTTPMFAQPDQHHHGEQMIPWNQIFEHGQSLYKQYTPVSGLFPFVNGFVQHIILGGTVTDYVPAISITMLLFCFIIMFFVYKHLGGSYALLFAIIFILPCYNRQYMVLPILLILTLPELIKRKRYWILTWIFACFLAGLYYPLFGAAILLGTTPLAIYICTQLISEHKYNNKIQALDFRSFDYMFLTFVALVALTILASIPLLIRILKHTLTYKDQTITADGITLSNQTVPDFFLPMLRSSETLRNTLYIGIRFLLPAIGLWLLVYFVIKIKNNIYRLALIGGFITLCISYTYTLVRADVDKTLSRTAPILIVIIGMFLGVFIIKAFIKKDTLITNTVKNPVPFGYLSLGICLSLPVLLYMQISQIKNPDIWTYQDGDSSLIMDDAKKICSYYEVPGNFLKSDDTDLDDDCKAYLGKGFMVDDQIHYIQQYKAVIDKVRAVQDNLPSPRTQVTYMAFDGQGFFDYVGATCYGTGFIPAARSYKAQKEIWDSDPDNKPIVFFIQPEYDYYIFKWMMEEGYVYSSLDYAFYPADLYEVLAEKDLVLASDCRPEALPLDFGQSAMSFGNSYNSLSELLETNKETLPTSIDSMSYDVLYLVLNQIGESDNHYKLIITWADSNETFYPGNEIDCIFNNENRTLLIPIGMNEAWSLSNINDFIISIVNQEDESVIYSCSYQSILYEGLPDFIDTLEFYQLKTVQ